MPVDVAEWLLEAPGQELRLAANAGERYGLVKNRKQALDYILLVFDGKGFANRDRIQEDATPTRSSQARGSHMAP